MKKWVDWSDWKPGQVDSDPMSRPLSKNIKTGADAVKEALTTGKLPDLFGPAPRQPTDQEMFGHLVVTEEMMKAREKEWENRISKINSREFSKSIDHKNKSSVSDRVWTPGKSFNSMLTEEELEERNKTVGGDGGDNID